MIWKTGKCCVSKNTALKNGGENPDFDFIPLLFTLLTEKPFVLRPVSFIATSYR